MAKRAARQTNKRSAAVRRVKKASRRAAPPKSQASAGRKSASKKAIRRKKPVRKAAVARAGKVAPRPKKAAPRRRKAARPTPTRPAAAKPVPRKARKPREAASSTRGVAPGLARERRLLREDDGVPTPPSSLDLDRKGSAVRTGRAEIAEERENLGAMQALTGGDVDADAENAFFSGDEAPGGDNPTPDQDIVDDIGRALGVEYQDAEELRGSDKVVERDKHRWELDPASSEDYRDRR